MRKLLIAGNWKMNLIDNIEPVIENNKNRNLDILVCPPFVYLQKYAGILEGTSIQLGAQNAYYEDNGAFTGETSYEFLKDFNVNYVIIGHSERRHKFHEDDDLINKKVKIGIEKGFNIILCVGEKEEDRNMNKQNTVVGSQIEIALGGIENNFENIIIAYEPVWAIGTGKTATPFDAEEMHRFIREKVAEIAGKNIAQNLRILYGGSVKEDNVKDMIRQDNIDGVLIGGASLKYEKFNKIIEIAENTNI